MNLYNLHNSKLDRYDEYNHLIASIIDGQLSWNDFSPILHIIKKSPTKAFSYAEQVFRCRWLEAEPFIITNSFCRYMYALTVIKGRWVEAEPYIMTEPREAFYYTSMVIKSRWLEAEPYIMKDSREAFYYASVVIGSRWYEAEHYIMKSEHWWDLYKKRFNI